jgi:uncharacterized protein
LFDLYPEKDRQEIYQQLQQLAFSDRSEEKIVSTDEIVMVAAEPQPIPVRVEWADGSITEDWENPPPQIDQLKEKILSLLNREGKSLLAINSLVQARDAELNIAKKTVEIRREEAEKLIWKYAKYKAIAIAVNPIAVLDLCGGVVTDLALIRSLAKLYGLPITNYEAGKLWRKILASSGGLLLSEVVSSFILGFGKSTAAIATGFENPGVFTTYLTAAGLQGAIAGYGTYAIGQVARQYLEKGCCWGPLGASTVIQDILSEIEPNTIVYRLRQEIGM